MIYFKNIHIANPDPNIVEKAIRSYSLKRNVTFDFISLDDHVGKDKYFLGLENDKAILITRVRTPFERFMPKLIIRFQKSNAFATYQVRLSLLSCGILCLLTMSLILNLLSTVRDYIVLENIIGISLLLALFLGITLLEMAIVKHRINKAIRKTTENEYLK